MEEIIKDYKGTRRSPIRSIRNQFRKFKDIIILTKKSGVVEPKGSKSGGRSNKKFSYCYYCTTDIYNNDIYNNEVIDKSGYRYHSKYKFFAMTFNKPKLIDSIVNIGNTRVRIISKY